MVQSCIERSQAFQFVKSDSRRESGKDRGVSDMKRVAGDLQLETYNATSTGRHNPIFHRLEFKTHAGISLDFESCGPWLPRYSCFIIAVYRIALAQIRSRLIWLTTFPEGKSRFLS